MASSAIRSSPAAEKPELAADGQVAEYIGDLVSQLERLAWTHGHARLANLLEICREEAERISKQPVAR